MRLQPKSISRLSLEKLLKRRKSSLKEFVSENGISSYDRLVSYCENMGVESPTKEAFKSTQEVGRPAESPIVEEVVVAPVVSTIDVENYEVVPVTPSPIIDVVDSSSREIESQRVSSKKRKNG